ncbi:MAG: phenylalanine--tRNA ligase subunit beta [Actinobacteria bacterium]|nr:phenylalanine--tRNA ligase subunit beta [Actinomycetota bacterium]
MRVPLSWLREYVPFELPLDELLEVMGRNGLEVEEVRRPGAGVERVVVARVLDVSDHPNADKLVVATVDDGGGERTVLAGARNITAGDLVPLAVPGAVLPTAEGGTFEISRREMRGITSDGMLCSARELQVTDDHSGIMVLGDADAPGGPSLGTDIHELLPLGEPVVDVAIPADRGDLHSVYGIARDLAAILGTEVATAPGPGEGSETVRGEYGDVPVKVDAHEGCSRYVGWAVHDLRIDRSPWWLRRRLEVCGIRSISNLVDVTNYVMLELGQPLHAFDLDPLHGPEIVVRWAEPGERLMTLDGHDRELLETDLVIADADRAIALAGVMGGEDTEVGPSTQRVLLEAAAFDPASVRRTSRRLGLVSEASIRFERRVDPDGSWRAAARAVQLLHELAGGTDAGVRVSGEGEASPEPVRLDTSWCARFLGLRDLATEEQADLLRRAQIAVEILDGTTLEATPPSWRGDLARPADLAEEIARLHGYENIPASLPAVALRGGLDRRQRAERDLRTAATGGGFHEAHTGPFVAPDALTLLFPQDERVRLDNPVAKDTDTMRPGLAEGLLGSARRNVGLGREGLALFELGRIFRVPGGELEAALPGAWTGSWTRESGDPLPFQPLTLGAVAYGARAGRDWLDRDEPWDLFDVLGLFDEAARRLTRDRVGLERTADEHPALHPGRTAVLSYEGTFVGVAGQLHPDEADRRDLPETTVIGELVLDPLWAHLRDTSFDTRRARELARHQAMGVDVAVLADDDLPYARIEDAVRSGAGELLDGLWWFDEYRGEQVGQGRRSLAFHLRLQADDRQLTDEDAETVIDGVAASVTELGAELRR